MLETWVNNRGFTQTATYHKTNLTFREAAYETMKDIRARTNKTLIVPISGGSDSVLIYHIAKDLGIEIKTIHQRYWDGDKLINEYESKTVDPDMVDVYQDIDCTAGGELRTSQWIKEVYQDYYPMPWWAAAFPWMRHILDPDNDFIISGGQQGVKELNYFDNSISFDSPGIFTFIPIGFRGFEHAAFIGDNPIILYTAFDQTSRNMMRNMSGPVEHGSVFKKMLFEHNFPEFNHLLKLEQIEWQWPGGPIRSPEGLAKSRHPSHGVGLESEAEAVEPTLHHWWQFRSEYGNIRGYIPDFQVWDPMEKLDLFFDCIDNNVPISNSWCEWNWNLSDYGKEKLQYKIFTDKIEHFPASEPRSSLW